jgi:4-amino-4-deoxy-L-arabinose transferase-like glycosyltransferase
MAFVDLALPAGERVLLSRTAGRPLAKAAAIFLILTGGWALARYAADGPAFFRHMLLNDLLGITLTVQEGHRGHPLYYLDVLQRYQYEWLGAAILICIFSPSARRRIRDAVVGLHTGHTARVLAAWAGVCLLVPSMMQTKLSWYLNPFYPVCAIGIALVLVAGLADRRVLSSRARRMAVAASIVLAVGVSHGRSIWHTTVQRSLDRSPQGLLVARAPMLAGARVFKAAWEPADRLVAEVFVGVREGVTAGPGDFERRSAAGDFLLVSRGDTVPAIVSLVAAGPRYLLYRRPRDSRTGGPDID